MKKGDQTKRQILEKAKVHFAHYGYTGVTMKDICEICGISRGGLYYYFGSTKEIFLEILEQDKSEVGELQKDSSGKKMPAELIFKWFLQYRKHNGIIGESAGFSFVIQEFTHKEPELSDYMRMRREAAQHSMASLFEYGQKTGDFKSFDVHTMALTVLLLLDSLEVNANVLNITEEEIDKQLEVICHLIIK